MGLRRKGQAFHFQENGGGYDIIKYHGYTWRTILKEVSFDKKYFVSFQDRNDKNAQHLLITNYKIGD